MKDRQSKREKERKKERGEMSSTSSTSSGSFGMCSHKLYARSGVASAAAASNGSRRGGGKREGHATGDCLLLLPSGSADHSNQTISICRFSL